MQHSPISYNVRGAAEATGYSRSHLYLAMNDGRLKYFMRGSRRFIFHSDLEQFLKAEAARGAA